MAEERFCSIHGPYDATYPACPYCSGSYKQPLPPKPLEGETRGPVDTGGGRRLASAEEAATRVEPAEPASRPPKHFLDDDVDILPGQDDKTEFTRLDSTASSLQGILWVKEGSQRGRIYKILDGTIIGRKSGNLIVNDPKVSNPHAKITVEDEQFTLWDFGSKNGCYVNGERIRAATSLKENDLVRIGDTVFILKIL